MTTFVNIRFTRPKLSKSLPEKPLMQRHRLRIRGGKKEGKIVKKLKISVKGVLP
jgi:hypothetical protein